MIFGLGTPPNSNLEIYLAPQKKKKNMKTADSPHAAAKAES